MDLKQDIPEIIVSRLPRYLRMLQRMAKEGIETTSSQELGKLLGISAAQIRKDLSQFGEFGKQGTGYSISYLVRQLQEILNVDRVWDMALVGVGDLGHAIARYQGFSDCGFRIVMVFDSDTKKVGTEAGGFTIFAVSDMVRLISQAGIRVAMITTPAGAAQAACDLLVKAGVRAILNYAPVVLSAPVGVRVQNIDPVIHLQRMSFYLA